MARNEPSDAVVLTVTASATVSDRPVIINGVVLAPASASCTVTLYDPPAWNALTTVGAVLKLVVSGAASDSSVVYHSDGGIVFNNGCIAVVAGAGAQSTVIFAKI